MIMILMSIGDVNSYVLLWVKQREVVHFITPKLPARWVEWHGGIKPMWREGSLATDWGGPKRIGGNRMDEYSYGHLLVITGYKWDYTFYKWGYKYL